MNTVISALALSVALAAPSWPTSYSVAQESAVAQRKPLVVLFGSGPQGWTRLTHEAPFASEVNRVLTEKYACVYVDTSGQQGQKLAQDFGLRGSTPGVVISDRTGGSQAFWHEGNLNNASLVRYLNRFADQGAASRTETVSTVDLRVSEPAPAPAPVSAPVSERVNPPVPVAAKAVNWHSNYFAASKVGAEARKPMAIVFGRGPNQWSPVNEVTNVLAEQYTCVWVNTDSDDGRQLARTFQIDGTGLVLSDRACSTQAFWHQGDLTAQSMTHYLTKYADPNVHVTGTETVNTPRYTSQPAPTRAANC